MSDRYEMRGLSAQEIVTEMKIGWNLGNSLDSLARSDAGLSAETAWGNPRTTPSIIAAVKQAGFGAVRIPVTWAGHFSPSADCQIDAAWMDRVETVVNYVLDEEMYAIINLHHDGIGTTERGAWLLPCTECLAEVQTRLTRLWTQIAARFAKYGDRLLFEGMNEPHMEDDWTGNADCYAAVNRLNAAFIETVRASGGNNAGRCLLVPPYAASAKVLPIQSMVLPPDENLILSIHSYFPTEFCFPARDVLWEIPREDWGTERDRSKLRRMFQTLSDNFIDLGRPVIIGEMGAVEKEADAERITWASVYISEAKRRGITCFWWDTFMSDDAMGLLDRRTCKWKHPALVQAIIDAANHPDSDL